MKPVVSLLLCIAAGFAVFSVFLYLYQRKLIYRPHRLDRDRTEITRYADREIRFDHDGVTLHGWLLNPDARTLLIYYGGNAEELSWCLDLYGDFDGHAALMVNYRGYGESGGKPTEEGLVADALALFDHYRPDYDSVVLCGRSLGSGIAVRVAAERDCDALVLITPYDSIAAVGQSWFWYMPVKYLVVDRYEAVRHAPEVDCPTLVVLSETDRVIPHKHAEALMEKLGGDPQRVVIDDAAHNSLNGFPAFKEALNNFLSKHEPVSR